MIDRILGKTKHQAKKLEIFARENNLREGWLSLGNQLPSTHLTDLKLK
jgi:N6-adenosine-specific RNA methylase IME4